MFQQRKTINVGWDLDVIKGMTVSIEASTPDNLDNFEEVRSADNDGWATVTFPQDFAGECNIVVKGSRSGEQSGTAVIE